MRLTEQGFNEAAVIADAPLLCPPKSVKGIIIQWRWQILSNRFLQTLPGNRNASHSLVNLVLFPSIVRRNHVNSNVPKRITTLIYLTQKQQVPTNGPFLVCL